MKYRAPEKVGMVSDYITLPQARSSLALKLGETIRPLIPWLSASRKCACENGQHTQGQGFKGPTQLPNFLHLETCEVLHPIHCPNYGRQRTQQLDSFSISHLNREIERDSFLVSLPSGEKDISRIWFHLSLASLSGANQLRNFPGKENVADGREVADGHRVPRDLGCSTRQDQNY
ncbi:hypothetical protein RRG08_004195 [Elysia crispata]|uniref:Uncharacterized protein n=1 Tax=Elysia crispata TaxID=231223 RepID=A0AAE0YWH8_9GAST|nr:hypothetical protein RRG08_004195 [Elysia crispata]